MTRERVSGAGFRPAFLDDPALQTVLRALPGARLVGGCVRDAVVARPVADIDLATPELPDTVTARLHAAGVKVVPTGLQHGTVTAVAGGTPFEVTTLRRDLDTDGRHARVQWTSDWREDAARRDFTINAMSLSPDGTLHDYFDGLDDLRAGRVRFVGDPAVRIAEDFLRILRYFRFLARYGAGAPDPAALQAVRNGVAGLPRLSPERVWSELKRILAIADVGPTLSLMADTGVLAAVVPEPAGTDRVATLPAEPLLRLAALSSAPADTLADRFRMSNEERKRLQSWQDAPVLAAGLVEDEVRRARADWPADALTGAAWLRGGDGGAVEQLLAGQSPVHFTLEGRDVLALGVPPGPQVGALLRELRAWWLAGGARADPAACRAELARMVQNRPVAEPGPG